MDLTRTTSEMKLRQVDEDEEDLSEVLASNRELRKEPYQTLITSRAGRTFSQCHNLLLLTYTRILHLGS